MQKYIYRGLSIYDGYDGYSVHDGYSELIEFPKDKYSLDDIHIYIDWLKKSLKTINFEGYLLNIKKEKLAEAIEKLNGNNYYDEANNITYTNGIRSIYKYCRKFNFNFKKVVIALYWNGCWSPAKFNIKTDGLEVI